MTRRVNPSNKGGNLQFILRPAQGVTGTKAHKHMMVTTKDGKLRISNKMSNRYLQHIEIVG